MQTKSGETATLEVKVIGKPKPTPKWLKANEEIIPSDDYLIENYPDGTSVLTITNVQPNVVDHITFEAVNAVGKAKTATKFQIEGILSYKFDVVIIQNRFRLFVLSNYYSVLFSALAKQKFKSKFLIHTLLIPIPQKQYTHSYTNTNNYYAHVLLCVVMML